jgi:hypothetical protein
MAAATTTTTTVSATHRGRGTGAASRTSVTGAGDMGPPAAMSRRIIVEGHRASAVSVTGIIVVIAMLIITAVISGIADVSRATIIVPVVITGASIDPVVVTKSIIHPNTHHSPGASSEKQGHSQQE